MTLSSGASVFGHRPEAVRGADAMVQAQNMDIDHIEVVKVLTRSCQSTDAPADVGGTVRNRSDTQFIVRHGEAAVQLSDRSEERFRAMSEASRAGDARKAAGPYGRSDGQSANLAGAELTVVVPTLNERGNIESLLHRLETVLRGNPDIGK
jgi:hypothetical protein